MINMKIVKGYEILKVFPFVELPESRDGSREVFGWGRVLVPNVGEEGLVQMFSKEDVLRWIDYFYHKMGEYPELSIDKDASWFSKCTLKNTTSKKALEKYMDVKSRWMEYHSVTE